MATGESVRWHSSTTHPADAPLVAEFGHEVEERGQARDHDVAPPFLRVGVVAAARNLPAVARHALQPFAEVGEELPHERDRRDRDDDGVRGPRHEVGDDFAEEQRLPCPGRGVKDSAVDRAGVDTCEVDGERLGLPSARGATLPRLALRRRKRWRVS